MDGLRARVYGRVQGVNFRWMIKSFADKEGIRGFVRNLDDGGIEIVAQGERKKLENFISWIKNSPGFAKVEKTEVEWTKKSENFRGFEIVREENYIKDRLKGIVSLGKSILNNDKRK